jgi:RNA 3'-terminal phosphate cyclase
MLEQQGLKVVWTVAQRRPGSLGSAGSVIIEARGFYPSGSGEQEIRLATLRANSAFAGN